MPDNITPQVPLVDRTALEQAVSGYQPKGIPEPLPMVPYIPMNTPLPRVDGEPTPMSISAIENAVLSARNNSGKLTGGSIPRSLAEVTSSRYDNFVPGDYNNEDAYAQGQGWTAKMVNGVGKGLALTAGTFLQSTLGLVNGVGRWAQDGRFASFYDNPENRAIDDIYKKLEDVLPNYYTDAEKNASWYSGTKLFSANFLWDGIVKNMGFAAGAALSGGVYAAAVKGLASLPGLSRLVSLGRGAEALALQEEALLSANAVSSVGKIKNLSDKFLSSYNILSPGGRAVVAGLATTGEAGFEAFQNLNEFRNTKIQEWRDTHNGQDPSGADLAAINSAADSVGNTSMFLNTVLLTATNYIQFPKILGSSYRAEKGIVNSLTKEIDDLVKNEAGDLVSSAVPKGFAGRLFSGTKKVLPYTFSPSEAFEEGAQYAIGQGVNDYFSKKAKGKNADFFDSLNVGIRETLGTDEGMENILIGGLSGAIMQARDTYIENRDRAKDTASAIQAMNKWKFSSFTKETIDAVDRGTAIQKDREKYLRQGDILMSKEAERDYIINYLTPRIKYGRFDLVKADIDDYKRLASTEEGFEQLVKEGKVVEGDTQPSYLQRINNLEATANNIKSLYQSLNLRYGGSDKYTSAVIDKMIYAATKVADYDVRIPQLSSNLITSGIDVDSVINGVMVEDQTAYDAALAKIDDLEAKFVINADQKQDLVRDVTDLSELAIRRKLMLQEYSDLKVAPEKYQEVVTKEPESKQTVSGPIVLKTKDGDLEIEVGKEYYGSESMRMKKSKEGVFYKDFTRFTVVGRTEDGKLIIKPYSSDPDAESETIEVDENYFEKYSINELSSLNKRPNEKFWVEMSGITFDYKLGGGEVVKGTIRYDKKKDKLTFVSVDGKQKFNVTRGDFSAKKGFKEAKIVPFGKLSPRAIEALNTPLSEEEMRSRMEAKNEIVGEVMSNIKSQIDEVNSNIEKSRQELDAVKKELDDLSVTKDGKPRKSYVGKARKMLKSLTADYKRIEDTIAELENEKENLNNTLEYLQETYENRELVPDTYREVLKSIKDDIDAMKEMVSNTDQSIAVSKSLLEGIEDTIKSLLTSLNNFIEDLKKRNPDIPLFVEDFQQNIERFLGEEGAKQFVQDRLGLTETVMELEDLIKSREENIKLPEMKAAAAKISSQLSDLQKKLQELQSQQKMKEKVFKEFESAIQNYENKLEEEEQLKKNEEAKQAVLKSAELGDPTEVVESDEYDPTPRKEALTVVKATISPSELFNNAPLADHHVRANAFGFRMPGFKNKENIRGVVVTSNNEQKFLPGLTQFLKDNGNLQVEVDTDETIALVVVSVDPETGEVLLVDVDGQPIDPSLSNEEKLNRAIFQVYPLNKVDKKGKPVLTWSNGESMFREDTPKEVVDSLTEQYVLWREETIANPSDELIDIAPSFGIPETIPGETTSVQKAGLISDNTLKTDAVIDVPTLEGVVNNYENPLGKPFLNINGSHVPLRNRNLTAQEAETIYQAIRRLSINLLKDTNLQSDESKRILEYLRSMIYWGEPREGKEAGQNSVFFREVADDGVSEVLKLFIKGEEQNITFTPSDIKANKDVIISLLESTYNHVNSRMTSSEWNEPYEEVLSISNEGVFETRRWPNYQSYLLSDKLPDEDGNLTGGSRSDIPLSTNIRPLSDADDVNRKGIYFINNSTERFVKPEVRIKRKATATRKKAARKAAPKKGAKKTAPKKAAAPKGKVAIVPLGKFKLDGEAVNQIKTKQKKTIYFRADASLIRKGDIKNGIKIIFTDSANNPVGDAKAVQETLMTNNKLSKEDSINQLKTAVLAQIQSDLVSGKPKKGKPVSVDDQYVFGDEEEEETATDEEPETEETEGPAIDVNQEYTVEDDPDLEDDLNDLDDDVPFRRIVKEQIKRFEGENWNKLEKWLKSNFPNVPVYRVKNVIQATNGQQAWGMFKDGAIYIYENAEVGTAYHEVFHAVWRMFTDSEERGSIMNEFRQRKGEFFDRKSLKNIKYSEATDNQLEEHLAEEFKDYVQEGKIPAKPREGRPFILKLFADIVNFIKEFFTGNKAQVNTANLFDRIGSGYYKQYSPYHSSLAFAKTGVIDIEDAFGTDSAEYSIATFSSQEVHDLMQEMTYQTIGELIETNKDLFNLPDVNKTELYNNIRTEVRKTVTRLYKAAEDSINEGGLTKEEIKEAERLKVKSLSMRASIKNDEIWNALVEKHSEYLMKYNIEFDENDNIELNEENKTKDTPFGSPEKIDAFRKASPAVKLLLSTLPMVEVSKTNPNKTDKIRSSIGGVKLLPTAEAFIKIMNNVYNSRNIDDMLMRIKEMAKEDPNYRQLYSRVTRRSYDTPGIDLTNLTKEHDLDLLNALWSSFRKQAPDVQNVYILEDGTVQVGEANLATAARQIKSEMVNAIVKVIKKDKSPYFVKSKKDNAYVGVPAAVAKVPLTNNADRIKFLKTLGITFKQSDINKLDKLSAKKIKVFKEAVAGIKKSISEADKVATLTGKVLNINKRLLQLAEVKAFIENPEFDSTFYGISGEKKQTYIGTNAASDLYDALSQVKNFKTDIPKLYPQYSYLLTDSFVKGSVILNKMFDLNTGERITDADEDLMHSAIAEGTDNATNGKSKESSKLTYKERFLQELNLNLEGYYLNLVPGDASLEWMMKMGNHISNKQLLSGFGEVYNIFKGYFLSELELSRENRPVSKGRNNKDLRFFKGIFDATDKSLHSDILKASGNPLTVYKAFEDRINTALEKFIREESKKTKQLLMKMEVLTKSKDNTWTAEDLNLESKENISSEALDRQLNMLSINYMINNIELHKLLYSDPYQYSDELKRIKNFLSPRTPLIHNSKKLNAMFNKIWNGMYPNKNDIARTDFTREYMTSTTLSDVKAYLDLKGYTFGWEETDGGGTILYRAYRNFRIRNSNWNSAEEKQFKYDIVWEKIYKGKGLTDKQKAEKGLTVSEEEQKIYDAGNPHVKSAYTPLKPIVAGNKGNGKSWNDVMLDKFALYPLSYRIIHEINPEANALKLYDKMQAEDIDYVVFKSGRKVGAEATNDYYNPSDATFNNEKFKGVIKVPLAIISVQAEVPSKDTNEVTRGSQMTKLITMDFMEAGVPIDFEPDNKDFNDRYAKWIAMSNDEKLAYNDGNNLYKEIKHNEALLKTLIVNGYNNLLKTLGIKEVADGYEIADITKVVETLRQEFLKRDINDNIISALSGYENNDVVIEATPAYQQIRNILYSIADKDVISQKLPGGMKVQIPSTGFESVRPVPEKEGLFQSDFLNFYVNDEGKRVCEIMVGRWFKSTRSDEELLEYLNKHPDGQRILSGLAFRTPTQKQNSIDSFVIKKFLPREFGDSVIIPSALVKKSGSDFDIDKLSTYLKNLYINKSGYPQLIEYLTDKNSTAQERYFHWVIENSTVDARKYVKFLTKSIVGEIKGRFANAFAVLEGKYPSKIEEIKTTAYAGLTELYEKDLPSKLTDQEEYMQKLFDKGRDVFFSLEDETREDYWELKSRMRIQNVKGPEEIKRYLSLTLAKIEDPNTYSEDVDILKDMVTIYEEELRVMGLTNEFITEYKKAALDKYRKTKNALISAASDEFNEEFNDLEENYRSEKNDFDFEYAKEVATMDELQSFEEFETKPIYEQNVRKAIENEYIESSQRLVSSKENFDKLILPNSADTLKKLSDKIVEKTKQITLDYSDPKNMLDRTFMSSLRHAFVTGKYAIGIAAVNQTNHSLNQRQPIYVDLSRLDKLSKADQNWLGDAKLKFFNDKGEQNFNTMMVDGVEVTTLSMIFTKSGDYISDILSQFIDGYVDISKGPWIMQLGATPNVAGTWMFLVKSGVPIDQVAYFMNQPIIRDYLQKLENAGYTWLFNDNFVNEIKDSYKYRSAITIDKSKLPADLESRLGKEDFTPKEKAEQQFILDEFLKYAKLAEHMFHVTQGSNFDTANFNDPFLVDKKEMQLVKAQNTIISSVDDLLENSFLETMRLYIGKMRNSLAEILIADKKRVRSIIVANLEPHVNLSDREFVKLAQKIVSDFFDWAVQTNPKVKGDVKFNTLIEKALIEDDSYVSQVSDFVEDVRSNPKHPLFNNQIIKILEPVLSDKFGEGYVNNIKIKNKDNKAYDQNQIIYAFKELKDHLKSKNSGLYKKLRTIAVLQSGLSNSPISFTSLLPYEDFKDVYNEILSKLETLPNLELFNTLDVFARNNWNNDDIIPHAKAKLIQSSTTEEYYYNTNMNFLPKYIQAAVAKEVIPPVMTMSVFSREGNSDIIVYQWEDESYSINERKAMRKRGDYSFIKKGLFKKVKDDYGNPFIYTTGKGDRVYSNYIFQAINAWGDSFRANEFYTTPRKSVINNGFIKVTEVEPSKIIPYFTGQAIAEKKQTVQGPIATPKRSGEKINIYAGTGENAELSNFAVRPFDFWVGNEVKNFKTVEGAFQAAKLGQTNSYITTKKLTAEQLQLLKKLQNATGAEARVLGKNIKDLNVKNWDNVSSITMKRLLYESFKQNPEALDKLLATGNATLTHTQDKGKWGTEFPKLLMEVREELRPMQQVSTGVSGKEIKPKGRPAIKNRNKNSCG